MKNETATREEKKLVAAIVGKLINLLNEEQQNLRKTFSAFNSSGIGLTAAIAFMVSVLTFHIQHMAKINHEEAINDFIELLKIDLTQCVNRLPPKK